MTMVELRAARNAEPFQPFGLQTLMGEDFVVADPDRIALDPWGTNAVVFGTRGQIHIFDVGEIAVLTALPAPPLAQTDDLPDLFA